MIRIFLALVFSGLAFSQGFQGSLRGQISDPAGAAVAAAKLTLTDEAAGTARSTISSGVGEFTFASLNPATYTVTVEAPGFKMIQRTGIIVSTQSAVTVDLQLEIGMTTERIVVTDESPLLETANASTGTVVDRQKLLDLPNLGRNPFMMSKLSETVVQNGDPKFNRMQDQTGSSSISIAGGPVRGNNYTLDGISITDTQNRAVIIPSLEAVEEVKVQANTYDAEMGRTGGGTFNTFLRSGSNRLQGSVFGYIRETEWQANNFFSNRAGTARPEQPFRNYGGSIGGPIRIPKIYNGRNRSFFWISGEAYRQRATAGSRISVPTALERVGDFSQSLSRNLSAAPGSLQLVYDPLTTTTTGVRSPFPGNVIPASRINKIGLALGSYYPLPTVRGQFYGDPNFDATVSMPNRADQTTWKVDHELASWWKASASYLHYGSTEPDNQWFGNAATPNQDMLARKVDTTQVNSTFTPSPTLVVAVRYGFNRFPNFTYPFSLGFDLAKLGLPSSFTSKITNPSFPSISVDSLSGYGLGTTSFDVNSSRSFNVTATKTLSRHTVKWGFDWRYLRADRRPTSGPGSFSFSNVFTRSTPRTNVLGTGAGMATLLLGYPTGGSVTLGSYFYNYVHYLGGFLQDDWRVTSKLTLNFGLRYEYETTQRDRNNNFISGFDPSAPSPLQKTVPDPKLYGTLLYAGVDGNRVGAGNPLSAKLGPRFGLAYKLDAKTVVRGGYGIFWAPASFTPQSTLGYSQSTPIVASFDNNFTPAATLDNPYPNGFLTQAGNSERGSAGIGRSISAPAMDSRSAGYVQQYSFDLQREFPGAFVFSIGYIGSKSLSLDQDLNINQMDPAFLSLGGTALNQSVPNPMYNQGGVLNVGNPTIARSQLLKPFPQFTGVTITDADTRRAIYHAGYVKLQRRFSAGFTTLVTYTRSQNMALGSGPQNAYNPEAEYALASTHQPHRLSISGTYELPVGRGKTWLSSNRTLDMIVGGWSINAVGVTQSGSPLAITQSNDNSVFGTSSTRPSATGISPQPGGSFSDRIDNFINLAAFSITPQFSFGNLGPRISMRGPGLVNWDVSMFKTFTIRERFRAQFRAEALNATNTPLLALASTNVTNPNFGKLNSQTNFSRLVQLGVRLFW